MKYATCKHSSYKRIFAGLFIYFKFNLYLIIVQPGQLTNGKKREKYKVGSEAGHYILTKMISRADVAHFMLNELLNPAQLHQKVGISY